MLLDRRGEAGPQRSTEHSQNRRGAARFGKEFRLGGFGSAAERVEGGEGQG